MKDNKAKIYMISSLVVLVIAVIVSGTYAYYVWTTSDSDTTKIVAGIGAATVTFDGGSDINANLRPVSDKSKGIIKNISVKGDTTGLVFNMYLDITSIDTGLKDESFRYELYKGTTKVKEGNFSDSYLTSNTVTCTKNNTNHIVLLTNESISTSKTSYTLYIWIDGANYTNPNTMMNKTFSFKLHADGEGAIMKGYTAADYITDLYTEAAKETVTNNSITYNTAPSVSLMNDRLGGTTEDLDAGNIRYYGASPNNYIYFNCAAYPGIYYAWQSSNTQEHLNNPKSESECLTNFNNIFNCSTNYTAMGFNNQTDCENKYTEDVLNQGRRVMCTGSEVIEEPTNCELWRIIGVFDGKLKIVRNKNLDGKYLRWDYDKNNDGTSTGSDWDWAESSLQKLLNEKYYNGDKIGTITYYNTDSQQDTLNMSEIGIKNDLTRSFISEEKWYLGATDYLFVDEAYAAERSGNVCSNCGSAISTWNGKIALLNVSDTGYSYEFKGCLDKKTSDYKDDCNDWLGGSPFWLLNYGINTGVVYFNYYQTTNEYYSSRMYPVKPTLYLISDIKIVGGAGTSDNPYLISK